MIRHYCSDRLYYAVEGDDGTDDAALGILLARIDEHLGTLPSSLVVTISGDPRRLGPPTSPTSPTSPTPSPSQTAFLERVDLTANRLAFSPARERLIDELAAKIKSHLRSRHTSALTLLMDGPPGTGKSTLAREVARRVGVETFRPSSQLQTKFIGETATRISDIFRFLKTRQAVLIWDDLDRIFSDRGYETDSASRDHRDTLATLFAGLDETPVVVIGSTNAKGILDEAFTSRVAIRKTVPAVTADERRDLLRTISRRDHAMTSQEVQEIVDAAPWMSFRDIETFCRSMSGPTLPIPRIVDAWRNTFAERVLHADWSRPQPAERRATSRIWDIDIAEAGHVVWIGAKDDQALGASILAHGQLAQMNQLARDDEVKSVCYDRRRDLLLLGTDKALCVVSRARTGHVDVASLRTKHGSVWDARWITDELILAAYHDGTISLCRYDGEQLTGDLSTTTVKRCRNVRWLGRRRELDFFVVGSEQPTFPILCVDRGATHIRQINQVPYPEKDKLAHRRVATIPSGTASSFIAIPSERGASIYQWNDGADISLAANITSPGCRTCTFDLASPRFAMAVGNEIHVFSSFLRASMEHPRVVTSAAPVTAMSFGRLGQSLVWGTDDGGVFSAATIAEHD